MEGSASAAGSKFDLIFGWVSRYGLATVLAVMLTFYVVWTDFDKHRDVSDALTRLASSQLQLADRQAQTAVVLQQIERDLRVACRLP